MSKANGESDEEDDYLSERFLNPPTTSSSSKTTANQTYAERRRQAQRISEQKNIVGRIRSRKEIEEEARREGLSRSLFERAREEEQASKRRKVEGGGDEEEEEEEEEEKPAPKNKAMAMMLKMGFKEGQALGRKEPESAPPHDLDVKGEQILSKRPQATSADARSPPPVTPATNHLVEPLPLAAWAGRKGLGLGKRMFAVEPRLNPSINNFILNGGVDPETQRSHDEYRTRARDEYQRNRDTGRLIKARKTLLDLDEKNGVQFNILWIDPQNLESIPPNLLRQLANLGSGAPLDEQDNRDSAKRLRAQMKADALQPLETDLLDETSTSTIPMGGKAPAPALTVTSNPETVFGDDTVQDTRDWLQLNVQQRLTFTLDHLRKQYLYCFWCGAQYESVAELAELCPGEDEDAHD